ncbi:uracil-DNA glycosylase [Desulfosporosinus youngiae]|uniref:Uracil-DNA glycosylase n=1 Tax=Desulfosporosinus youngiae DSM 17734 TaxID=768710 RepID=H5Y333_9FIRM|nr:uracil-DNA glycosylase [Desulfosporosinus youngiae]EHQ88728.1 uracil-DNA glycosylase [Desulfosporosinus youngiae DSM 17734]
MDSCFEPVIWPEDKLPKEASGYKECELCTEKSRIIWGEGNPKAPVVIILDNPGAREDKDGNEYVCGTRQTLQTALHRANLAPDDIYVTYLLKCRPLGRYNKEEVRAFSKPFLIQQIKTIQPKLIVCLGDTVVQVMFDDKEAHVKNLRGLWHVVLGYPCIVSYHPLAVRRRPNLTRQFMEDWDMLGRWL